MPPRQGTAVLWRPRNLLTEVRFTGMLDEAGKRIRTVPEAVNPVSVLSGRGQEARVPA